LVDSQDKNIKKTLDDLFINIREKKTNMKKKYRKFSTKEFIQEKWTITNFYQVLGVNSNSDKKEIKSAYYKLAKQLSCLKLKD